MGRVALALRNTLTAVSALAGVAVVNVLLLALAQSRIPFRATRAVWVVDFVTGLVALTAVLVTLRVVLPLPLENAYWFLRFTAWPHLWIVVPSLLALVWVAHIARCRFASQGYA